MKKTFYDMRTKTAVFIMSFLAFCTIIISCLSLFLLTLPNGLNAFADKGYALSENVAANLAHQVAADAIEYLRNGGSGTLLNEENCNVSVTVTDKSGNVVFQNFTAKALNTKVTGSSDIWTDQYDYEAYVKSELTAPDFTKTVLKTLELLITLRYWFIFSLFAGILTIIFTVLFLYKNAGINEQNEVVPRFIEMLPLDLYTAITLAVQFSLLYLGYTCAQEVFENAGAFVFLAFITLVLLFFYVSFIALITSFSIRSKTGKILSDNLITYTAKLIRIILGFVFNLIKSLFAAIGMMFSSLAGTLKSFLILCAFAASELLVFGLSDNREGAFVLIWLISFPLCWLSLANMYSIKKATEEIKNGKTDVVIPQKYMLPVFKRYANDLEDIRNGINAAVCEKLKSERFKTDLIANVSHDIKTPLTSIISYVDLLLRDNVSKEEQDEYIAVLQKQSARLKKLTEDVIEASKAESGEVKAELAPTDVNLLIDQIAAEYEDKIKNADLVLVVNKDDKIPPINTDGRLLSRVLTNLFSNAVKYSLPQSRIYVSSSAGENEYMLEVKNVSREELNISAEELMLRFVRGERSRAGEGSGLGLSIAKSLAEICGGKLEIEINGDLFTAKVVFRA